MKTDFQTFDIRRMIAATPGTVYTLWSDSKRKEAWFCWDSDDWTHDRYDADLREGGHERVRFSNPDIGSFTYASHIFHMRPSTGLIYGYTMTGDGNPISVSQASVTLTAKDDGTEVIYTEQVVFLDDGDSLKTRVPGCESVLDRLKTAAEAHVHA